MSQGYRTPPLYMGGGGSPPSPCGVSESLSGSPFFTAFGEPSDSLQPYGCENMVSANALSQTPAAPIPHLLYPIHLLHRSTLTFHHALSSLRVPDAYTSATQMLQAGGLSIKIILSFFNKNIYYHIRNKEEYQEPYSICATQQRGGDSMKTMTNNITESQRKTDLVTFYVTVARMPLRSAIAFVAPMTSDEAEVVLCSKLGTLSEEWC